eukprot:CAMPEP_0118922652 /NCGR_PEP_ID=MMETSP1169-20130426/1517_1 /TAXON_ID=36882 /ORGANISM="Pyramimonas obovata, Strain CCMP722" /LENGTH=154 /DNA_ID=CAMNT_0006863565 /DNA_START=222 /DNA_END=686 /DNA_ORIENTATION=+
MISEQCVEVYPHTASTPGSKQDKTAAAYDQLQELKCTLQKQVEHRQTAVQENIRETKALLKRLEARRLARDTNHGLRSSGDSKSMQFEVYGRCPLQLAGQLLHAASSSEEHQGLTNHLLLQKEKATKDYMQLSNPPDSNALQVVDADGNFHVIY